MYIEHFIIKCTNGPLNWSNALLANYVCSGLNLAAGKAENAISLSSIRQGCYHLPEKSNRFHARHFVGCASILVASILGCNFKFIVASTPYNGQLCI